MLTLLIVAIIVVILIVIFLLVRFLRKKNKIQAPTQSGEVLNNQIYVGNLSYQVSEQDLKDFFVKFGSIEQVRIVRNHGSGRSKGFGFVTYRNANEAKNALVAHSEKFQGRNIVVRIAKPR